MKILFLLGQFLGLTASLWGMLSDDLLWVATAVLIGGLLSLWMWRRNNA
jgi:hypothetical protein